jgi:hypothetical protein
MTFKSIGVIIPEQFGNPLYFTEILKQLGFFMEIVDPKKIQNGIANTSSFKVLAICGPMMIQGEDMKVIKEWVQKGGGLLTVGNVMGLEDVLGVNFIPNTEGRFPFPVGGVKNNSLGEGYLYPCFSNPVVAELFSTLKSIYFPLHGFGCVPEEIDDAEIYAEYKPMTDSNTDSKAKTKTVFPAITVKRLGKGIALSIAVDFVLTIRHIQEGDYVYQDGIPPADGMAPIDDGILKCEDGMVLDWGMDRRPISPKYQIPAFIVPIVDIWKDLMVKCLEKISSVINFPLERVKYWPKGAEFVMLISHDTDGNDEKLAQGFLKSVTDMGIHTTWCLQHPGYSKQLCNSIVSAGHELAFHYDAETKAKNGYEAKTSKLFSFETLSEQVKKTLKHTNLSSLPQSKFYSNKNHYTRWEGQIDFFLWLERLGITVDQSKGPSKCGTTGFPFGSAHPWQPMNEKGELIHCLEISFQCQDLGLQGPEDIGEDILEAVRSVHGVCHFIFHPAHFPKANVQENFHKLVEMAKERGALFLRSIDIGTWYFNRLKFIESNGKKELNDVRIEHFNPKMNKWENI